VEHHNAKSQETSRPSNRREAHTVTHQDREAGDNASQEIVSEASQENGVGIGEALDPQGQHEEAHNQEERTSKEKEHTMTWQYYIKAIYAGVIAFLGSLGTALADPGVTSQQWVFITLGTLLAFGGILGWQTAPAAISTSVKE
jgi:cation transport ATPase